MIHVNIRPFFIHIKVVKMFTAKKMVDKNANPKGSWEVTSFLIV